MHAVRGIDLTVSPGEIVAFLGPNGAGKTTTIDMVLGLSPPDHRQRRGPRHASRARPIARGLVSAVMQTGGLLKDLTVARDACATPPACSPTPGRSTRCSSAAGISRHRRPPGGQVLRRRAAAAAVRDGAAVRPRAAAPRRADHRHGRRGPARLLVGDPRGRRAGPHRRCSRRTTSRRPTQYADRIVLVSHGQVVADGTGRADQGAGVRPHRAGHAAGCRPGRPRTALAGCRDGRAAGRQRLVHARPTATPSPATCSPTTDARDLEITARGPRGRLHLPDLGQRRPKEQPDDRHHRRPTGVQRGSRRWAASTAPLLRPRAAPACCATGAP